MNTHNDEYIIIQNLSNPQKAFERLQNEFIDIMYPDSITGYVLVMLLDVNIEPENPEKLAWLKDLLDSVLQEIGETDYTVSPFNPSV